MCDKADTALPVRGERKAQEGEASAEKLVPPESIPGRS